MGNKIILLGAKGMLGCDVRKVFTDTEIVSLDLPELDITNPAQLEEVISDADIVINCAAFTDVEKAETEPEQAFKVNAEAVGNIAHIAHKNNIYVIHISTDFVFDGNKPTAYLETDRSNPINVYGKSKLEGEILLSEQHNNYAIIRIQWSYGKNGNNFIKKLISLSKQQDSLKVVDDQFGSPTYTHDVAKIICQFTRKKPQGLFHYAAAGRANRYEIAKFVFEKLKIKTKLTPCRSSEFKTAAQRPLNSCFCCDKITPLLDEPIERWSVSLERFLETL